MFGTTIFAEMSELAAHTGALNLGQGFPDFDGPPEVHEAAIAAIQAGRNQYSPLPGEPELRAAIVDHQARFYGIDVYETSELLVTAGATEAIAAAVLGLLERGDEVIVFEPFYDSIRLAGATQRVVQLVAPTWTFDPEALERAVTPRSRMLLLNTPHNPTGKVFTDAELALIANIAIEHDLIVVADEVYEHLCYEGSHRPIATLPGMAERTLTISSGGKTFSCTGWKIGWVTGPADLIASVRAVKQFLTYVSGGPLQLGVAAGLNLPDSYFADLTAQMRSRRDSLAAALAAVGLDPIVPAGGYFITTDLGAIGERDGYQFCLDLPARAGVVAIPSVVFYEDRAAGMSLVRWAFCKRDEVIADAANRLLQLR
jgi:N-succinyldiaminopimelate aminotransferase